MGIMYTTAHDVNEAYPSVVAAVLDAGEDANPRGTKTRECSPAIIEIRDTRNPLITSFGRPVNVAFALAEVLWILGGRDDLWFLHKFNGQIQNYSDDGVRFNAAYGRRMRGLYGQDQLLNLVETLREDPDSRQAVIGLWDPNADRNFTIFPDGDSGGPHVTKDRACNVIGHAMIRDGRLNWYQHLRSNDALWGVPYNWMQWLHVQRFAADRLGVPVGSYFHMADSLHVYDHQYDESRLISDFDLFQVMNESCDVGGLTDAVLNQLLREVEALIRTPTSESAVGPEVPWYWLQALGIIRAHLLYNAGEDEAAMEQMSSLLSRPMAVAHLRFMYYWRWHKDEFRGNSNLSWLFGSLRPEVLSWVTSSSFASAPISRG